MPPSAPERWSGSTVTRQTEADAGVRGRGRPPHISNSSIRPRFTPLALRVQRLATFLGDAHAPRGGAAGFELVTHARGNAAGGEDQDIRNRSGAFLLRAA